MLPLATGFKPQPLLYLLTCSCASRSHSFADPNLILASTLRALFRAHALVPARLLRTSVRLTSKRSRLMTVNHSARSHDQREGVRSALCIVPQQRTRIETRFEAEALNLFVDTKKMNSICELHGLYRRNTRSYAFIREQRAQQKMAYR